MKRLATSFALALLFLVPAQAVLAAGAPATVAVPVLEAAPSVNGTIDASWAKAAKISLDTDFTYKRAAEEPTTVYVAQDGAFLDVAFVVSQKGTQTAGQETNSMSVMGDDY